MNDHDLLLEIKGDVKQIVQVLEDQKEALVVHAISDDKTFTEIKKNQDFTNRIIYGCIGVFVFVQFLVKFIK